MRSVHLDEYDVTVFENGDIFQNGKKKAHSYDYHGYPRVYINLPSGKRLGAFVHRLFAMAFISNPENKKCVNHINGNKGDFSLSNLEWVTHKENTIHAYKYHLITKYSKRSQNIERDKKIFELYRTPGMTQVKIAKELGLTRSRVSQIIKNNFIDDMIAG